MTLTDPPLLLADDLRIDVGGAVALERASFTVHARSLAILGESTGLMSALSGAAPLRAGTLHLLGRDVGKGEHLDIVGLAPLDPPLPPSWTALEYLQRSAMLAGSPKDSAGRLAHEALRTIDALSLGEARLGHLGQAERRVVVLAQAIVNSPAVLIAALPLFGLSGAPAEYVLRAFDKAAKNRGFIVSALREDPSSLEYALIERAEERLAFASGSLLDSGQAHEASAGRVYSLTVVRHAEAFRQNLVARGIALWGGPQNFWAQLPEGADISILLAASVEAGAPIVQLSPREEC